MRREWMLVSIVVVLFTMSAAHSQPIKNPRPLLSDVPGFFLAGSMVDWFPETPEEKIIREYWHSKPPDEVRRIKIYGTAEERKNLDVVTIGLVWHAFPSQERALEYAYGRWYLDRGGPLGTATPGSVSGQKIGDFCWTDKHHGSSITFVAGPSLVGVTVTDSKDRPIDPAFVEGLAVEILARIKTKRK